MQEPAAPSSLNRSARSARFFNLLHRYKNLLCKRWWVLPLGLALGLAVQGFRIWQAPPAFTSVGRMIVGPRINTQQIGASYMEEFTQFLGTQVQLMKSDTVREKARVRVHSLKPNLTPVDVELQISVSPKTTIFNLQATGSDAEYTRAYLDACMDEYILIKKDIRTSTSDTTLAGLTAQLAASEADLKKYDEEEMNFKSTNNVAVVQEQGNYAARYLVQLNGDLARLRTELQFLTLLDLDQNLARQQKETSLPATGTGSRPGDTPLNLLNMDYFRAKQELQLKKVELQDWSEYLKPKHPRMVALNEEVARAEKLLEIYKDQSLETLEKRRKSILIEIETLERDIKEWDVKALEVSKKMADYDRIRAAKQRVQNAYDRLLMAMKSIDADKDASPESVAIYERASPAKPARSNPVAVLGIGAVLGLMAAMAILLLVDRLDDRPASFADLQDVFDEPVLGQIPLEQSGQRNGAVKLLQLDDQRHALLEAYRNLRSSLLYMASEGKRPRVLVVTSAIPGDGKSMTAANFAITLALSGSRVLLVDADLRKGLLHRHFGTEATPGFNEVLLEQADWRKTIRGTFVDKLFFLPRGNTARNPGEMLLGPVSLKLIKEFAAEYDYVIYDTAPVMAADDVTSLSPQVEGVIFVIRADHTSGRVARAALDLLYQRDVSVLGLVLNGVQTNASEYYYYRYKDYYHDEKTA